MSEKPKIVGLTGSAVGLSALALAFGVCCVAPWAVTLLGVAGAVLLARLAFMQPYICGDRKVAGQVDSAPHTVALNGDDQPLGKCPKS